MVTLVYFDSNHLSAATDKTPRDSSTSTTTGTITCPGIIFPKIKSQDEIDEESKKKRREEKLRLKVNRKAMFSKKGR